MPLINTNFAGVITFSRASGATWFNSAGNLIGVDFSTTSNTIGTGSKTFTLDATAGVVRGWATGDTVLISDQSNSSNNMTGTVTSYTASTQVLVVNVTSTGGSGTITSWRIGNLMQRLDYDPDTLAAQGLLIEEQRTNSIRNNTMQGAVAGTPGTLPTNWTNNITAGLTQEIVGTGTENGITYIDWRLSGTATGTSQIAFESTTHITAAASQAWTATSYVRLVAGSLTNVSSLQMCIREGTAAGGFVRDENANFTPTSAALRTQRASVAIASTNALTERVMPRIFANTVGAVDFTLRIGLPQLELGAFATSVIPTTVAQVTRNADQASVNTLSPWFNATSGTLYTESVLARQNATGGLEVASIRNAGNTSYIRTFYRASGATGQSVLDTSVTQCDLTATGVISANTTVKMALAYAANDFAASGNGGAVVTDTTGTVPSGLTEMQLGGVGILCGYLRRVTYYPRRLSNAELQAITV